MIQLINRTLVPTAYVALVASSLPLVPFNAIAYKVLPYKIADPIVATLAAPWGAAMFALVSVDLLTRK